MKALTLRNPPPVVASEIQRRAKEMKTSLNRAVISLLEEHISKGKSREPVRHHDLDFLMGAWTPEEADEFDGRIAKQRRIDREMWKR
ncbi:MAG: hypothetical protein HY815_02435 [Candidatus Riflebacteria bacterium]|nr:hypothetical protein [Candidatus Riflebacteria bacterium]